jgi:hypothetical protein
MQLSSCTLRAAAAGRAAVRPPRRAIPNARAAPAGLRLCRRRSAAAAPPSSLPATTTQAPSSVSQRQTTTTTTTTPPPQSLPPPSDVTAAVALPLDYYRALGVARGAARDAIRRAYEQRAAAATSSSDPSDPSSYYASGQAAAPPSLPRDLFSQDALFARAALLRQAVETLSDVDSRKAYDRRAVPASPLPGSTAAHASAVGPVVYSVDVSAADVPGALVLMQEAGGQAAKVAALGDAWLRAHASAFPAEAADVAAAVALARCDLAAEALDAAEAAAGTVAGEQGGLAFRVRPACEQLERALALLRRGAGNRAPQLQQQIAQALDDYAPRLSIELLALPLPGSAEEEAAAAEAGAAAAAAAVAAKDEDEESGDDRAAAASLAASAAFTARNAQLRARGLELARRVLWEDTTPWWGAEDDGGQGGGGAREAYVAALREVATAREQIALWSDLPPGARPSAAELLDTALAHVAEGFASRQPRLVARAAALYEQVAAAAWRASAASGGAPGGFDVSVERAACALLLGDPSSAERLLGFAPDPPAAQQQQYVDPEVQAFVLAQSGLPPQALTADAAADGALLPGLCALTEAWLQDAVLPRFRADPAAEAQAAAQAAHAAVQGQQQQGADDDEAAIAAAALQRPSSPLDAWFEAPWVRAYARVTYATRGVLQGGVARAVAAAVTAAVALVRAVLGWLWRMATAPVAAVAAALGGRRYGGGGGSNAAAPAMMVPQDAALQQQVSMERAAEAELHSWGDAYYQGNGGGQGGPASAVGGGLTAAAPVVDAGAMTQEEEDALLEFDRGALESESLTVEELRARLSGKAPPAHDAEDAVEEEEEEEREGEPTTATAAPSRPMPRPRPTARAPPAALTNPVPPAPDALEVPAVQHPSLAADASASAPAADDDLEASPFTGAAFRGKREAAAASLRALELDMWESRREEPAGAAKLVASALAGALKGLLAAAAVAGAVAAARAAGVGGGGDAARPAGKAVVAPAAASAAAPAAVTSSPAASSADASSSSSSEAPALSRRAAQKVVASWLEAKGKALGGAKRSGSGAASAAPDACLDSCLTGKMLQKWRALAREASAAGWCWRYRVRSVVVTDVAPAPGGAGTLLVTAAVDEAGEVRRVGGGASASGAAASGPSWARFWRRGGGEAQPADSYDARYVMRYTLSPAADGGWRISDSAMVGDMVRA